ncbi:MAG TPA: gamma-glutamyl-gamma-aminobutyrate hydrolase family protein [Thermoanaerobaculia bacterium]
MAGGASGGRRGRIVVVAGGHDKAGPALAALAAVGLDGERLTVVCPGDEAAGSHAVAELVAGASGVALLGGGDPHPSTYGEEPLPEGRLTLEPGRDELERAVIEAARARRVPTWAICRGMQMVDVVLGGTLWQDIPTQLPGALLHDQSYPRDALIHPIEVTAPDTGLGAVLAAETALVNSRHHQGIKDVAPGLVVVGRAPDRLVEAYAGADPDWWLEGVQWHPENLLPMAQQRALVERFAAAVAAYEERGAS